VKWEERKKSKCMIGPPREGRGGTPFKEDLEGMNSSITFKPPKRAIFSFKGTST
jgi:hypothetical protein